MAVTFSSYEAMMGTVKRFWTIHTSEWILVKGIRPIFDQACTIL